MAKKYYYAVKSGHIPGVYENWDMCKKQVDGYKGAIYKKFQTKKEALDFINDVQDTSALSLDNLKDNQLIAYVDGSYSPEMHLFSYGAIIFTKEGKKLYSDAFQNSQYADLRNVAGELYGATIVMKYCVDNGFTECHLYYDYLGIEKWAKKQWKANLDMTKKYQNYYAGIKDKCNFIFHKVEAHTGDKYNEEVDKLAKKAVENKIKEMESGSL